MGFFHPLFALCNSLNLSILIGEGSYNNRDNRSTGEGTGLKAVSNRMSRIHLFCVIWYERFLGEKGAQDGARYFRDTRDSRSV